MNAFRVYLLRNKEKLQRKRQRTAIRELSDAMELPDEEFLENYKVSKDMVEYLCEELEYLCEELEYLCEELEVDLAPRTADGLPVIFKVLSSLKILINGHYQRGVGQDQNISIGQTTVCKYLNQFVGAVNRRLKPKWIQFPATENNRRLVANKFESKFGLPNILGVIDCTHVQIFPPTKPHNAQYINRHGYTSINVQLVADADCRLLNANANYPGRVHDQFIFNHSVIKAELQRLFNSRIGQYYLLGDSGYALEPWLMTPIRNAEGGAEARYTEWHCRTRNVIERTNGYLKGTFRILGIDRSLHYSPKKASELIYTCCTLYNIMKHFRCPMEYTEMENESELNEDVAMNARLLGHANERRAHIINSYFN